MSPDSVLVMTYNIGYMTLHRSVRAYNLILYVIKSNGKSNGKGKFRGKGRAVRVAIKSIPQQPES